VLHPAFVPFFVLVALAVGLVIAVVVIVVGRLIRGQRRWDAVFWFVVAAVPVAFFVVPLIYTKHESAKRIVPVGIRAHVAVMLGASLMEAQAEWLYPNRKESERLVMFYRELDDPVADIEAMDRHVAELEQKLGIRLRDKIYWVRGSLLGRGSLAFRGLALGSENGPAGDLDSHELAHAVLEQVRIPAADPPMVLHEGWAESQAGRSSIDLAAQALEVKRQDGAIDLADLLTADLYRFDAGQAYTYGAAFVDFLLRKYSVGQFIKIYNQWNVKTSEQDFRAVYGLSISQLEDAFWRDVEMVAQGNHEGTATNSNGRQHSK
jgi:hypothetical protein